jgi:hypothetical protein
MRSIVKLLLSAVLVLGLPASALAAPALVVTAQPSPVAIFSTFTGDLYVVGTIRCSTNAVVEIFANVAQPDDQNPVVSRSRSINVSCGPTPSLWVVRLRPSDADPGLSGPYSQGPAQLNWHWAADGQIFGGPMPIYIVRF